MLVDRVLAIEFERVVGHLSSKLVIVGVNARSVERVRLVVRVGSDELEVLNLVLNLKEGCCVGEHIKRQERISQ